MGDFKKRGSYGGESKAGYKPRGKFGASRDFAGRPSYGAGRTAPNRNGYKVQMHPATCATCGKACEVPFRPTGEKPVYCNNCFRGAQTGAPQSYAKPSVVANDSRLDDLKKQVASIQVKLDMILKAMEQNAPKTKKAKEVPVQPAEPLV